ncbi:glycoside hydrolase family 43 protein [Amnibacterium kyonggiense]|uniref:Glycosyl hydrolase family 43 n=1 Tax=Amnibacterium kyonggiense TaxID=595671 RepID=A0A4R7FLK6_9MICO|nr:glycoside hydrolase family 43 protein [Amnibacterium kyonggiense]TDS77259.1 hypothetical protein CLV52_2201 [Amnibacterium kyonggiense]
MHDPAGHLLVHFIEASEGHGEQVFFSLSDGPDPTRWTRANGSRPVLESRMGTTGARDPFVVRGEDGFVILATDLRVWGGGPHRWEEWTRTGSRSLLVWRSPDLVTWTGPELVEVAPPTAGMAWAPEARWSPEDGEYRVSWSSALYAEDDPEHRGPGYSRILEARTRDFRTFTDPVVALDHGRPVIDARVYDIGGRRVRFAKEEPGPGSICVFQEVETADGWTLVASRIGTDRYEHVEGAMLVQDPLRHRWLLWLDQYDRMPQGFVAHASEDPLSGVWLPLDDTEFQVPPNTKHGSVLPLSGAEWERVRRAFP